MGIFQIIAKKYKDAKQKSLNKKDFKEVLLQTVEDGKLTKEEIEELNKRREEFGFSEEDIKSMKMEVFTKAFNVIKSDQKATKEEEIELRKIQTYLGLGDDQIQHTKRELAKLRLLTEIQEGNMPIINIANLVIQKNEKVYWAEPSTLLEEKVLRRAYAGGSSGVSFRIAKGVSYRVGSSRGHLVSETGIVVVSTGKLIITSKRVIFQGDKKSFATKIDNILDNQLYTNAIYFSENNKSKMRMVKFDKIGNYDVVGAVLSYAINHYGEKD
ncbi:MAG: hypothetical protein WC322_03455 [Candidatus Paceibacterota bacterium]|jgi:hypothetical protein